MSRLNGWKEIASHFGKSVRTVQRWERDLGLPVRRLHTPGGEIVFAHLHEIEAWERRLEGVDLSPQLEVGEADGDANHDASATPSERSSQPASRSRRRAIGVAALAVAGIAATVLVFRVWSDAGQPASWTMEGNTFVVFGDDGRRLWEHRFEFPLPAEHLAPAYAEPPRVVMEDLDGDGSSEVLMVTLVQTTEHCRLRVFNHDGTVRFEAQPDRTVRFGDKDFAGPYAVNRFIVATERDGSKAIWLVASHETWFPSVVQKLSPDGQVLGEYWTNGHLRVLLAAEMAGRPVVVVGGMNNDMVGAALTVLDQAKPGGSVPSRQDEYRCRNCPTGGPLALLVFPGTEINRVLDGSRPLVWAVKQRPDGGWDVEVILAQFEAPSGGVFRAISYYTLTSDFRPAGASVEDDYRRTHLALQAHGLLDHPFDESEVEQLWPVLSWNGERFEEIRPPAAQR